jgi:hypothetical protein
LRQVIESLFGSKVLYKLATPVRTLLLQETEKPISFNFPQKIALVHVLEITLVHILEELGSTLASDILHTGPASLFWFDSVQLVVLASS